MSKLAKLAKVSDFLNISRCENGWMVEVAGRDDKENWKAVKIVCNSEEELINLIKEYNLSEMDN